MTARAHPQTARRAGAAGAARALALAVAAAVLLALGVPGCERQSGSGDGAAGGSEYGGAPMNAPASGAPTNAPAPGSRQPASKQAAAAAASQAASQAAAAAQAAPAEDDAPVILMLGDSLSAGAGLPIELAFPTLLQERLREQGYPYRIVNAGVSGDTSAGGLARLDWLLRQRIDILVLELGANDGLRGLSVDNMRNNLAAIIERVKARGITVVLTGMAMPSNYGRDYTRAFRDVYPELARRYDLPFVPFLLEGVAMRPELNLADGIHPNERGQQIVADNVWAVLQPLLDKP